MNGTSTFSQPVPDSPTLSWRRRRRLVQAVAAFVTAGALVGYVLPRAAGTTVHAIGTTISAVTTRDLVVLSALWCAGLLAHSFVLTGALPGLSRRRALMLNLTGSAVSNVLPFGGAAGMSLNYVMVRSWSISATGFASYTLVTNLWVVLLKLAMPAVALVVLLASGARVGQAVGLAAAVAAVGLALVVAGLGAGLASRPRAVRGASRLAGAVSRMAGLARRGVNAPALSRALLDCRDSTVQVVRTRGAQLTAGMSAYAVLQATLLWAALGAVHAGVTPAQVLAAFAVDRVLTLVVVTPGGLGFAETGTAAALVALGALPAAAAAGVLLYRAYTFALEIPVGGTWLGGWLLARRISRSGGRP